MVVIIHFLDHPMPQDSPLPSPLPKKPTGINPFLLEKSYGVFQLIQLHRITKFNDLKCLYIYSTRTTTLFPLEATYPFLVGCKDIVSEKIKGLKDQFCWKGGWGG